MKKIIALLICLTLIGLTACHHKDRVQAKPHWFKHYTHYRVEKHQQHLQFDFDNLEIDTLFRTQVAHFYHQRNYLPVWTINGLQEKKVDSLMEHLLHAYEHGIPSSYFAYDSILLHIEDLKQHKVANNDELYAHLNHLEIMLTTAYLRYSAALNYGVVDPKTANGGKWLYAYETPDTLFFANALKESESFLEIVKKLQPSDENYLALRKEMRRLYPIKDTTFEEIPCFSAKVGQLSPHLAKICQRLHITGEYAPNQRDTSVLTDAVMKAVNLFRECNNIPTSDTLDNETINALNRPISYYTDKLAVNMERLRWRITPAKGETHIAVNIPDFTLQTFVDDEMVFKTKICCGKTQNPKNIPDRHKNGLVTAYKAETPLLHSEINTIVLNPEWSVPYDIIKNEYYYKLCRSNTACIKRERMYIRDHRNGKYVIPDSIDWNKVNQNNIPYRLYQTSGRHNALGQVKFSFPNGESVYLHDTNNKGAFNSRKRAFSHGCVRVQNPFELANIIYQYNEYDSIRTEQFHILVGQKPVTEDGEKYLEKLQQQDSIREANVSEAERPFFRKLRPTSISLRKKMPLYIEYYTCFVGENGQINYRDDIYYKDDNIITLLNRKTK